MPRSRVYRQRHKGPPRAPSKRPRPQRALTEAQRQEVLAEARSERFADRSPEYIVSTLPEEGKYHCSIRNHGQVERLAAIRNDALARAYALHPERFVHGLPVTHLPPDAVYINPPEDVIKTKTKVH